MGWTSCANWHNAEDVAAAVTREEATDKQRWNTLHAHLDKREGVLYTVVEVTERESGARRRFLGVTRVEEISRGEWGYKDMDESMHPYQYRCPLWMLDEVPEPNNEHARVWRAKVREYWAARGER